MRTYLAFLGIPLAAVALLNHSVDASGLGAAKTLTTVAEAQGPADLVVSPLALEHRLWVRTRLLQEKECPDVLVTGSSTVGHLADGMIPGLRLRNAYLGGPTVEDFEALAAILRRTQCRPKTFILGVDPWWSGNPAVDERRWMVLVDDYLEYHAQASPFVRLGVRAEVLWGRAEERLNFTTTRESAKLLVGGLRGTTTLGPRLVHESPEEFCASVKSEHYIRAADGRSVSCELWVPKPDARIQLADRYLRDNTHSMADWRELADDRLERLERLVHEWRRTFGAVVMVGMPYHPAAWARLREDPRVRRNLDALDARLGRMQEDGIELVSLRDPQKLMLANDDFEDGHHISPAGAQKVARYLADRAKALVPAKVTKE